ncbi:hypothetical protein NO2_0484 [Candidatus Termititenax persephonae]|uniref:Uncharacterized protein n=1 Tax=Candidatus Termititenax persephonae TaxID=2218525 RepID=A0A388TFM4_9BACT|nr:hypothetical protein NO2_0484 [Candidatus Termititenax persephonae]
MEPIVKTVPLPPRKGLTKVQQNLTAIGVPTTDNCPCVKTCQELGTYKQGSCFLGNNETQKCLAATNLLLLRVVKK